MLESDEFPTPASEEGLLRLCSQNGFLRWAMRSRPLRLRGGEEKKGQDAAEYLRRPGVTVVPGKAGFTVKPPSNEAAKFRRKARIVGCGNFQPKGGGGAAAESVRLGVAESSRRVGGCAMAT